MCHIVGVLRVFICGYSDSKRWDQGCTPAGEVYPLTGFILNVCTVESALDHLEFRGGPMAFVYPRSGSSSSG